MTAVMVREEQCVQPSWAIVVDLTPGEVVEGRNLKALRRMISCGLIALLVVCGGGYVLSAQHRSAAASRLDAVQARTAQLHAQANTYQDVTATAAAIQQIRSQLAVLFTGDVRVDVFLDTLRTALPPGMTIKDATVTINAAGVSGAASSGAGAASASGARIGNVTINGAGRRLADLSSYVEHLQAIAGVVDVIPTSDAVDSTGIQYTVSMGLTGQLLSHRFDISAKAGK